MKAFLKFSLLLALIVVGRLAKQPTPSVLAQAPTEIVPAAAASQVTLVHQVLTSEPVSPQPQTIGPYDDLRVADTMALTAF